MTQKYFRFALFLYIIAALYLATTTPISPHEANIFYNQSNSVSTLMHLGDRYIGGFLGLRIFFICFGVLAIMLFYRLNLTYFNRREDAYLSTTIFMFLPGILTATILANVSIMVLVLVLLFVILYEKNIRLPLPFLMLSLFFIHEASIIFFVALALYGVIHKDKKLAIGAFAFLLAFVFFAKGIDIGGRPSGHFLEIFGLYATVFSPLLFLYFFYTIYRILLREEKHLLWYISFTALAFSLILSLRQRVYITDFAPYVMISIVVMLDILNHSIRVRLPQFQKYYKQGFMIVMVVLLLNTALIVFHKVFFYLISDNNKHFASRIYEPYNLAKSLHAKGIRCYDGIEGREAYQLQYYHIVPCYK